MSCLRNTRQYKVFQGQLLSSSMQATQSLCGHVPVCFTFSKSKAGAADATWKWSGITSAQALREHAKQAAAIMLSLKFRQTCGFSPTNKYQLAFRTAGEIPPIANLPPYFEQYVTVKVTVDVDGRVADERIVAVLVGARFSKSCSQPFVNSSTVRPSMMVFQFLSQLDIVIHIPS